MKHRSIRFAVCVVAPVLSAACSSPNAAGPPGGTGSTSGSPVSSGSGNAGAGSGAPSGDGAGESGSGSVMAASGAGSGAASGSSGADGGLDHDGAAANDAGGPAAEASATGGMLPTIGGFDPNTACNGATGNILAIGGYDLATPLVKQSGDGSAWLSAAIGGPPPTAATVGATTGGSVDFEFAFSDPGAAKTGLVPGTYNATGIGTNPSLAIVWEVPEKCVAGAAPAQITIAEIQTHTAAGGPVLDSIAASWVQTCKFSGGPMMGAGCVRFSAAAARGDAGK